MAAQQVTCALYGLHAESLVQHRDVGQVTLLEALAAIDQMEQHDRDNPQTRALCAALGTPVVRTAEGLEVRLEGENDAGK